MGPSFNFYKFKDMQKNYKHKFNEMANNTYCLDKKLYHQWGEQGLLDNMKHHKHMQEEDTYNQIMSELNRLKDSNSPHGVNFATKDS